MRQREPTQNDDQQALAQAAAGIMTLATMLLRVAQDLESLVSRQTRRPTRSAKRSRRA